jgi:SAM-dependent methyltransferase
VLRQDSQCRSHRLFSDGANSHRGRMNQACIEYGTTHLTSEDVRGKSVLEVGSQNVNGSLRSYVEGLGPSRYFGVDMTPGAGVDEVCSAEKLLERFGPNAFDVVISTEMLEHVRDWRAVVNNMKGVLKPGGIMLFTTRSQGFAFHAYPFDFWRYELSDVSALFDDFETLNLESDPLEPGVFFKGRKPINWRARSLDGYALYSIILRRRSLDVSEGQVKLFRLFYPARFAVATVVTQPIRRGIKRLFGAA